MVENSKSYLLELFNASDWPEGAFFIDKTFSGKEIILYGAGESSHWFVEIIMKMHGYTPTVVIDKSFNKGDKYEGILAYNPSEFNPTEDQKENAIVVISVTNTKFHAEIKSFLENLGFMNIIFLKDIYEIHNPFGMPKELNTRGFEYYKDNKDKVIMSFELFEDDESREVFIKYIQTHMTRIPVSIAMRPRNEQYFPKDIKLNKGHSSFVSCGSYDGDTVRLLNSIYGKVKDVVCFEAEPSIFGRLNNFIEINKNNIADNIVALPCAAYSHEAIMPFSSGSGLGSRISENGNSQVQCVALDHILPNFAPTFISMDVEGVEPEILKGAENIIRAHKPDLGICIYHSPDHLWKIPLYLHNLDLGYKFYLRNYTSFTIETVLYATI